MTSTNFRLSGALKTLAAVFTAALLVTFASPAGAVTFTFSDIDNAGDGTDEGAALNGQFTVDVTDAGGGLAQFLFSNIGPLDSSIEQINFDNAAIVLASINSIVNGGPGVDFEFGNPNLPEGNLVSFDEDFGVVADNPAPFNGVNPGETVAVIFNLVGGATFDDVIAALIAGDLRIGFHAIALANGGSDSFINDIPDIPLPAAFPLMLAGIAGLSFASRKKKKA